MQLRRTSGVILVIGLLMGILTFCTQEPQEESKANDKQPVGYRNLAEGVSYVGMEQCRSCHGNIYETYIKTGMGQSFDHATREKSAARFDDHALVYDKEMDLYYRPFWRNDSLFFKEYRLDGTDTIHKRTEHISYVIGSGQHTNSHLVNFGGFVYQAPITYYTQDGKWDMAPGFEGGFNSRFSRIIGHECMTCHNGLPDFVAGSVNKYDKVATGIDCERCHGPGELHVKEKLEGKRVDTSKYIDYTIVNPGKLSKVQQMSACQRCHLQGIAVLQEGKNWEDFRPGMHLNEVMNVFLPRFSNSENDFIMASQADRLRMSDCYQLTDMTCITCHNPHITVKETPRAKFNNACINCHQAGGESELLECSEVQSKRVAMGNDCSKCHMPKSGSIDIPHVSISDHYIRKDYSTNDNLSYDEVEAIKEFLYLECRTDDNPSSLLKAQGYIAFYEKFSQRDFLLDSTLYFLNQTKEVRPGTLPTWVHYFYLKNNYVEIRMMARQFSPDDIADGWTLYRIGEAFASESFHDKALTYYSKAAKIDPYNLEFLTKQASALVFMGRNQEAAQVYQGIINQQPRYASAYSNLGYLYILSRNFVQAEELITKSLAIDPDYEQGWFNLLALYLEKQEIKKAKETLSIVINKFPENERALLIKDYLEQQP